MTRAELLALAGVRRPRGGRLLRDAFRVARPLEVSTKSTPTDLVSRRRRRRRAADPRAARTTRGPATRSWARRAARRTGHDRAALGRRPARRHGQLPLRHPAVGGQHRRARTPTGRSPASCTTRCATRSSPRGATAPPTLDGAPLHGSARGRSSRPRWSATGFGYDADVRERAGRDGAARLLPRVRDIRRFGTAALDLAWTACGRFDAYYERGLNAWDVAAGALICERAGLAVRELAPTPPTGPGILVAPPALADELSALVSD